MRRNQKKFNRIRALENIIKEHFGFLDEDQLDSIGKSYDFVHMEMYEVIKVNPYSVVLAHLSQEEYLEPLKLPEELRLMLKPHDTFLMQVGLKNESWYLLWCSPPYSEFTF
jgi:hypothetical protein